MLRRVRRGRCSWRSQLPYLRHASCGTRRDHRACSSAPRSSAWSGAIDDLWELDSLTKLAGQVLAAGVMAFQGVQLLCRCRSSGRARSCRRRCSVAADRPRRARHDQRDQLRRRARRAGRRRRRRSRRWRSSSTRYYVVQAATTRRRLLHAPSSSPRWSACCLGFLPHNFHPARLFMGDSGSMLIGLLLAGRDDLAHRQRRPRTANGGRASLPRCLPIARPAGGAAPAAARPGARGRPAHPAGGARCAPTRSTCTTGCSRSGTRHRRAVLLLYLWAALLALGSGVASRSSTSWRARGRPRWSPAVAVAADRVAAQVDPSDALVIAFTST